MRHDWTTFGFTQDQQMMRESVLDLLERELPVERVRELDSNSEFPLAAYNALAKGGWLGLPFGKEWGGSDGSHMDRAVLVEALGYHYLNIGTAFLMNTTYAGQHLNLHASDYLKQTFIPKIIDGSCRLAIAITEPEAGSDVASIRTRAIKRGDRYVLNGQKTYITLAHMANYIVTAAKTEPEAGAKGISLFLVPTDAKGLTIRKLDMLGRRPIHANDVFYADVEVPAEYLIGEEGSGFRYLMKCLNLERAGTSAASCGDMQHIIDYACAYAKERKQFGQPIANFQAIAHKLADMRIQAEASRLMIWRVAQMLDQGLDPRMETSIAKVFITEAGFNCANLGMQIMGGAGYMMDHDMQRFFRDSRLGPIGAGTNEIQRNIIAQNLLGTR